jgi:hypothetical protein
LEEEEERQEGLKGTLFLMILKLRWGAAPFSTSVRQPGAHLPTHINCNDISS